jgi:hypothetical protein
VCSSDLFLATTFRFVSPKKEAPKK